MTTLVAVKLTPSELDALDHLVELGYYKTRSNAIRQALFELFEQHGLQQEFRTQIRLERLRHPMRRPRRAAGTPRREGP